MYVYIYNYIYVYLNCFENGSNNFLYNENYEISTIHMKCDVLRTHHRFFKQYGTRDHLNI